MPNPPGRFGQNGEYLYRFELQRGGQVVTANFLDPFATGSGPAFLSSFLIGPSADFPWTDAAFRVPELDDLILYELQVQEFHSTFAGAIELFDYLQGLGVNCLSLMPVNPVKRGFDWGYGPIGYFTTEEAFGGNVGLKSLVDAAHAKGKWTAYKCIHIETVWPAKTGRSRTVLEQSARSGRRCIVAK